MHCYLWCMAVMVLGPWNLVATPECLNYLRSWLSKHSCAGMRWFYIVRFGCLAGLLNVLADISGMLDSYMGASVDLLRASVKEVIAVPKAEPLPVPKLAPPAPPPHRPAKPSAPPPPPPPGSDDPKAQ